ncbi:vezatin isoform X2 [Periophthalmus magnuspinnatus]|uniref:vezatin isoform X2 n=1 Tax=Periophthalmus magnuspinnatus TaxID=409849 RepID=UPI00145B05D1|nr:vezatin isoform X2 [Periophthalmus magnuspinnatus]
MTDGFDEDVVFENSPLFQYLHDLGHTDFEACPIASREKECVELEEDIRALSKGKNVKGGPLWRLADALWQWTPFYQAVKTRKLQQQLDTVFGQYSVRCILDQDVLLQEDVELIELLDPSLLTLGSSPSAFDSRAKTVPRPGFIFKPSIWDLTGLVGLAAVLISVCSDGLCSLAAVSWGLALLTWVGLKGTVFWRERGMQKDVYLRTTELQTLVHNSKTLTGLSRKALRLVQETEVISRGFTLVSAASTFSRAAPGTAPRGQQLIGLRKTLYRVLRTAFRASRRATCHMLKAYPLNSEIDNVTNYVSAVPLKELGLGLGLEHLGDEQAQELTDDYSLPALKILFQLWLGQSSECFRRLALLLSPQHVEELVENVPKEETVPLSPLYQTISVVTEPLHNTLAKCLSDMQRSYDFHRHFETQTKEGISHRAGRAKEKCRDLNTLHTSIRSLQLHLKTLLSEMIILEDDLEKMMVSEEPTEMPFEGYQDLSDRLHQLQPHMQASTGCWEDTIGQVDRMLKRANISSGDPKDAKQCCPPTYDISDLPQSYPIILDKDPVPEEMELEAYVSDSDADSEGRGSWCDMLSPEERDRQRREREESRRVLSELKSVLCFRASEGERMKRKQLLFSDQAAEPLTSNSETSDSTASTPKPTLTLISVEPGREEGKHLSEYSTGNKEEGKEGTVGPDPSETSVMEFSCGLEPEEEQTGQGLISKRGGEGASEHHQYDGIPVEEAELNSLGNFIKDNVPAVSVMDRLTEIHGSQALSFSSALASQVAARSRSIMTMEEQTFGDDDDHNDYDDDEEAD